MGGTARETAPFVVHGETDGLPGGEHHHLPFVPRILIDHFQNTDVRIRIGVIAVDARIVRPAAEHLAVARIGEIHGVRHPHQAVLLAVANQVAMLCAIAPQERKQHFATFLGRVPPVSGLEGFIGAGEKFLPAQAVKGHDYEAAVIVFLAAGDQCDQRQKDEEKVSFHKKQQVYRSRNSFRANSPGVIPVSFLKLRAMIL